MSEIPIQLVLVRDDDAIVDRAGNTVITRSGSTPGTGNVGALDPAVLKASLTDGAGNLRHSLVTAAYNGGVPTSAAELRPSLVTAEGNLKPSLIDAAGNLNASLLKTTSGGVIAGVIGVFDPTAGQE